MASCANCGTTILFGGKKAGNYRFCNDTCLSNGQYLLLADQIPDSIVLQHTKALHEGECPVCNKLKGTVDVHTSHTVWSALLLTSWKNVPRVSCRSCGTKSQVLALLSSLFLGWWGLPWGIVMTPVQILRNLFGITLGPKRDAPSEQLKKLVRIHLGKQIYLSRTKDDEI